MIRIQNVDAFRRRARWRAAVLLSTTMIAGLAFAGTSVRAETDKVEIESLKQEVALLRAITTYAVKLLRVMNLKKWANNLLSNYLAI